MHTTRNDLVSIVSSANQRLYFNAGNKEDLSMLDRNYYHNLGFHDCAKVKYENHPEDQGGGENAMSNITTASGEASGGDPVNGNDSTAAQHDGQQAGSTATTMITPRSINTTGQPQTLKRKRNLPGTPDPDSEVLALSPRTLMTTNRFVCEICNKGFQRDQNLQLHRRGHNLPWKLKQKSNKEVKKRVYICPEPSCAHHDPSRALGDLTGIKKHYSRKHGEKKWKCEKCSKRYAVQSDWKAHAKTCGSREYRCDCGTLFSRRDSFITHRAFCDALAEESARVSASLQAAGNEYILGNGMEQPVTMPAMGMSMSGMMMPRSGGDRHLLPPLKTEGQNLFAAGHVNETIAPPPLSSAASQQDQGLTVDFGANSNHRCNSLLVPPMWWDSQMSRSKTTLCGGVNKPIPPQQQYLSTPTSSINDTTNNSFFQVNQSPPKINNNKPHNLFGSQDYEIHKRLAAASQYNSLFTPTRTLLEFGVSPNWSNTNTTTTSQSSLSTSARINSSIGNNNNSRAAGSFLSYQNHELQQNSHSTPMSATAMLQKAALMGAAATNPSLLRGMGGSNDPTILVSYGGQDQTERETMSNLMSHMQQRRPSTDFHTSTSEAVLSNSLFGQRNMIDNVATMQGLMNSFSNEGWMGNHLIPQSAAVSQLHNEYESGGLLLQPSSSLREFDIPSDRPTLDFLGVGGRTLSQRERLPNLGSRVDMQTAADISI